MATYVCGTATDQGLMKYLTRRNSEKSVINRYIALRICLPRICEHVWLHDFEAEVTEAIKK